MKYALITGANSGLGNGATRELIKQGWTVFACDINTDKLVESENLIPLKFDATNEKQVKESKKEILKHTDNLQLIGNFVGFVAMGSLIENSYETMNRSFDINVGSMYIINRTFFTMLKKGKGRIINISSEAGLFGAKIFNNFYIATKHAVEIYNDGLRRELLCYDIPVIKIRPGAFKTNMQAGVEEQFLELYNSTKLYKEQLEKMKDGMIKELNSAKDVSIFVKTFMEAVNDESPKICYEINMSEDMAQFEKLSPEQQDALYLRIMK